MRDATKEHVEGQKSPDEISRLRSLFALSHSGAIMSALNPTDCTWPLFDECSLRSWEKFACSLLHEPKHFTNYLPYDHSNRFSFQIHTSTGQQWNQVWHKCHVITLHADQWTIECDRWQKNVIDSNSANIDINTAVVCVILFPRKGSCSIERCIHCAVGGLRAWMMWYPTVGNFEEFLTFLENCTAAVV